VSAGVGELKYTLKSRNILVKKSKSITRLLEEALEEEIRMSIAPLCEIEAEKRSTTVLYQLDEYALRIVDENNKEIWRESYGPYEQLRKAGDTTG
jgi:hypothetical protein